MKTEFTHQGHAGIYNPSTGKISWRNLQLNYRTCSGAMRGAIDVARTKPVSHSRESLKAFLASSPIL